MSEKACRDCRFLTNLSECPACKGKNLIERWKGFVFIVDPSKSEIAKKMKVTVPGKYALRVS